MISVDKESWKKQIDELVAEFRKANVEVNNHVGKAVQKCALKVESDAKKKFKGRDEESVDGEPPRVQTGRLRSSISHRMTSDTEAEVGTNVAYGKYLDPTPEIEAEFGTSTRPKHPFLTTALAENADYIKDQIAEGLKGAIDATM